jgi:hypothetical protein
MIPTLPAAALLVLKMFFLLGLFLYSIFAGVLVRQEQLMANVLEESFEPMIRLLVIGHLIVSVAIFLLAIIFL